MQDPFRNLLPDWQLINDNSTVFLFVVLVVPGFIFVFVRSQFKAGRVPSYPAGFLSYLATSYSVLGSVGFLTKLRLNPVHPTPSAWDWTFEALGEQFVLVALRDGTHIGGLMGSDSFVSSDPTERGIYIQQIYDIDETDNWKPMDHGVLIAGGEISSIEFWPLTNSGERTNEKDQ